MLRKSSVQIVFVLSALSAVMSLGGCSAIVKSSIDTQPRVTLTDAELNDPSRIVRGEPIAYAPQASAAALDGDLQRFAPVIVQGFQPGDGDSKYAHDDDALGTPMLAYDGESVHVDTARPAMFCRVEHALVHGVELKQLTYVFWYPRRPVGTVETGEVDGGVLRITLDAAGRPAVFECSQTCGCYHGVFVSDAVESAAVAQYATIARDRVHAVEPPLNGRDDWVVRGLVSIADFGPSARPILYISAGKHFCEAVAFAPVPAQIASRECVLRPYADLEAVQREGGGPAASMFNEKGLVIGGKRWKEEIVLGDLDNAGWPRRLDVMRINWDKEQWIDPLLIEQHLRVPDAMLDHAAVPRIGALADHPVERAAGTDAQHDERLTAESGTRGTLVMFTNRACLGCRAMKRDVLPDPRVQKRLHGWTVRVYDTATPDGAALAAVMRVSATPVLIAFDPSRHEISRSEDLLTVTEMLQAIPD